MAVMAGGLVNISINSQHKQTTGKGGNKMLSPTFKKARAGKTPQTTELLLELILCDHNSCERAGGCSEMTIPTAPSNAIGKTLSSGHVVDAKLSATFMVPIL